MGKPVNIALTTAHAQAAEFAALAGVASQPTDTTDLQNALRDAIARVAAQQTAIDAMNAAHGALADELAAEKAAHERTQAALTAATALAALTPAPDQPAA